MGRSPAATVRGTAFERLARERDEALEQQAATAEILKVISRSEFDLSTVLQALVNSAVRLCGADTGIVRRREGNTYPVAATSGFSETESDHFARYSVKPDRGSVFGRAILEGRSIHVPDLLADRDLNLERLKDYSKVVTIRTGLGVPLLREGKIIGVFTLQRRKRRPFTRKQIALAETFANQAVIAIENTRLFDEVQARTRDLSEALEQQTATSEVLEVISSSSGELEPVFDKMLENATRVCEANFGILNLWDGKYFRTVAGHNVPPAFAALRKDKLIEPHPQNLLSHVLETHQAVHVHDARTTPGYLAGAANAIETVDVAGARTIVVVPMLKEHELVGTITIYRTEVRPFSDKQLALLENFTRQAVIAIENTRLISETREALERQTATSNVLQVISKSMAETAPVFESILDGCEKLFQFNSAGIALVDGEQLQLQATRGPGTRILWSLFPQPLDSIFGDAIREGKPTYTANVAESATATDTVRFAARRVKGYSLLQVPMLWQNRSVGSMSIARLPNVGFSDKEVSLLKTFAAQAVIAIENTRLFNETKQALERQTATADVLKVIASSPSNLQPVFDAIAESSNRLVGGHSTTVQRFVDDRAELAAFTPTTAEGDAALKASFPRLLKDYPLLDLAYDGESAVIADTETETRIPESVRLLARSRGFRSMLLTPLVGDGGPTGLISVTRKEPGSFAPHHVGLLRTFADQAVIAIQNVRMFDEVQARTRELQESLQQQTATAEVLQIISSSPSDLAPVFDTMLENATRVCGAEFGSMNLLEGDMLRQVALYNAPSAFSARRAGKAFRIHPRTSLAHAIHGKQVVQVDDMRKHPAYLEGNPSSVELTELAGARTIVVVPMLQKNEVIGLITVYRQEVRPFSGRQIDLLTNFSRQVVIAIENARLLGELRQRTNDLSKSLDDLRTAQDRLVQTEKLASLGQLTAGIAHEIKNPLNFVNNFSALSAELVDEMTEVLADVGIEGKKREEIDEIRELLKSNLEKVVQHGKRADSIVKNMLLHSREGSGEQRSVDINALVDESLNLAYHGARAEKSAFNITIQRDFDASAGSAELFPQEITRALLNLISNGFYAATKRGSEGEAGFEPTLLAATKNLGNSVEIRVMDNGTGIPSDIKEKIFNPFFTTKPAGEGTGLGLSMTHDIVVKQHGGAIWVNTEPGVFTEFVVTLPRTTSSQSPQRSAK